VARNAALLFLIVFLTRLPFLGPGFGSDPDAWRIAGAARDIARTGHYVASRFPGTPVVEIADAALLRFGPLGLFLPVALWGAIAAVAFYVALCRLGMRGCFWAALALAFTPVFWIHTTDAMDYAWALGLALVALAFAVHGRATLAGALLGLAVGCRIASAVLVVPVALLLEGRGHARFLGAFVLFGALAFAPSFLTYGTRFLSDYEFGSVPWIYVLKGATRDVWGVIGSVAVGVALAIALFRLRAVPRRERLAVAAAAALTGAIYLRLPHEGAYLLPIVPFVLMFVARALGKPAAIALACLLPISALFVDVVESGRPEPGASKGTPFHAFGRALILNRDRGPLLEEIARRDFGLAYRDAIVEKASEISSRDIVMVYEFLPSVLWLVPPESTGHPTFVHLLDPAAAARSMRENRLVYATPAAREMEERIYHLTARDMNLRPLAVVAGSSH
jgi:hypothetical protein